MKWEESILISTYFSPGITIAQLVFSMRALVKNWRIDFMRQRPGESSQLRFSEQSQHMHRDASCRQLHYLSSLLSLSFGGNSNISTYRLFFKLLFIVTINCIVMRPGSTAHAARLQGPGGHCTKHRTKRQS